MAARRGGFDEQRRDQRAVLADADRHGAVALEVRQVVADQVEVIVQGLAAAGVGEVAVDAVARQLDDAAGLLVHAQANDAVVERRRPVQPPGLVAVRRARGDGVAAGGKGRHVLRQEDQLARGQPLRRDRLCPCRRRRDRRRRKAPSAESPARCAARRAC